MVTENDIRILGNSGYWELKMEGAIGGTYTGTFRFKCFLTPLERISANRELRELLGPNAALASEHDTNLALALTQLKYRIIESPPFWKGALANGMEGNIADEEIILTVLDAAIESEVKYSKEAKSKRREYLEKALELAEDVVNKKNAAVENSEEEK